MADALASTTAPSRTYKPYRDARGRFAKRAEAIEPAMELQASADAAIRGACASVGRLVDSATAAVLSRLMQRPGVPLADTRAASGLLDQIGHEIARQGTARKLGGGHAHR